MNWKHMAGAMAGMATLALAGTEIIRHAVASPDRTTAVTGMPLSTTDTHLLPGGATSINETYQDWRVICQQTDKRASCVMVQQLVDQKTHKTVMNMELSNDPQGLHGIVLLPFGLDLGKAVTVRADNVLLGQPIAFRTCLPAGCIVPVAFDTATFSRLRSSKAMQIAAISIRGQNVTFPVSLNGFVNASDRVRSIKK